MQRRTKQKYNHVHRDSRAHLAKRMSHHGDENRKKEKETKSSPKSREMSSYSGLVYQRRTHDLDNISSIQRNFT
jgi:hypothetical protein